MAAIFNNQLINQSLRIFIYLFFPLKFICLITCLFATASKVTTLWQYRNVYYYYYFVQITQNHSCNKR